MKIKILLAILFAFFCIYHIDAKNPPPKSINGVYKFSGKLNGKIPVFLWFVVQDSVLKGEVTYLRTAKRIPITIIGTITKDYGLVIEEFSKTGYITGSYKGKFDAQRFSGIWHAPGSEKELKFELIKKDTIINNIDIDLNPKNVTGEYLYRYGKDGDVGGIDIKQIKPGYYTFRINCVTMPQAHVADAQAVSAHMINNVITYKIPDEDCTFRIKVFKGFIIIDYPFIPVNCQFGTGASIDGVFIKTSDKADVELL